MSDTSTLVRPGPAPVLSPRKEPAARPSVAGSHNAEAVPPRARPNLYVPIHKALRLFMSDTLCRAGRVDVSDAGDLEAMLGQVDGLLDMCMGHLAHENDFLHTAMEVRVPGSAERTSGEHVEHLEAIAALRTDVGALRAAAPAWRDALALRLYRHLALFIAENFEHMHFEETVNMAMLWAHCSDAEILDIHHRLMAHIAPAEHAMAARWLLPANTPQERALIAGGMKREMPPEALLGILATVKPAIDGPGWRKLCAAAGVAVDFC